METLRFKINQLKYLKKIYGSRQNSWRGFSFFLQILMILQEKHHKLRIYRWTQAIGQLSVV